MTESQVLTAVWTGAFLLVHLGVIARVILRPHRQPASRVAWIVVMIVLPVIGILTYILLGETSIGRRRVSRLCAVLAVMPDLTKAPGMDSPNLQPKIPDTYAHLFRPLRGRIDLRNHRKILVIDNRITYCGSQNCADPEFRIKAKFAPWVDAMMRFEGPIARQNQYLFASDWMAQIGGDLTPLLRQPLPPGDPGLTAQVIGTGPTVYNSAMPEVFETLIYTARRELVITTPYYVPDEGMQTALCASARRGVRTTIIFPARNDSWIVAAASRSYYSDLLADGVRIYEYEGGLLHTKSLTLDGEITLIGSANMDRRSFDLNYENNILFYDPTLTAEMRRRQDAYLACSHPITAETVTQWPMTRRLWNNTIAMLGPIL